MGWPISRAYALPACLALPASPCLPAIWAGLASTSKGLGPLPCLAHAIVPLCRCHIPLKPLHNLEFRRANPLVSWTECRIDSIATRSWLASPYLLTHKAQQYHRLGAARGDGVGGEGATKAERAATAPAASSQEPGKLGKKVSKIKNVAFSPKRPALTFACDSNGFRGVGRGARTSPNRGRQEPSPGVKAESASGSHGR